MGRTATTIKKNSIWLNRFLALFFVVRLFVFVHEVNVTFKKMNMYVDNLIKTESCLQSRSICSQSVYSPSVKT